MSTIYALSTPPGEGGIAIIRLSGEDSLSIIKKHVDRDVEFEPRKMYYCFFTDEGEKIDEVMAVYLKAPKTYTREDMVEIQCHGSMLSASRIMSALAKSGAVSAEAGEFTKRAFLSGRLDLSQAEAIMDYIGAMTVASQKAALKGIQGGISKSIEDASNLMLDTIAHLEVAIDYPEEDIEPQAYAEVLETIDKTNAIILPLLDTKDSGKIQREGYKAAIIGVPNVGKSSLLNALLGEQRAIVTDIEGTTRDFIREYYAIGGIPFVMVDTAGIRQPGDVVEAAGIDRSVTESEDADCILFMVDATKPLSDEDRHIHEMINGKNVLLVINKIDAGEPLDEINELGYDSISISAKEGIGIDALKNALYEKAMKTFRGDSAQVTINARQADMLIGCKNALIAAKEQVDLGSDAECISIDLKEALYYLLSVIGKSLDDKIVDRIFENFCLGK